MASFSLPYGSGLVTIDLPKSAFVTLTPPEVSPLEDVGQALIDSVSYRSVGTPGGLHQLLHPQYPYTIVVRSPKSFHKTSYAPLQPLLYFMTQMGIPLYRIALLIGHSDTGKIEEQDLDAILDPAYRCQLECVACHDPDGQGLVSLGKNASGVSVSVHPLLIRRRVIVLDTVRPDSVLGFTGGGYPILQVCGRRTITECLRLGLAKGSGGLVASIQTGVTHGNPLVSAMNRILDMIDPFYGIFSLCDKEERPVAFFAGALSDAWKAACDAFYPTLGTPYDAAASAVLASAGGSPYDDYMITAVPGLFHAVSTLRSWGSVYYAACCQQGGPDALFSPLAKNGPAALHQKLFSEHVSLLDLMLLDLAQLPNNYRIHVQTKLNPQELASADVRTYRTMETMGAQISPDGSVMYFLPDAVHTYPYREDDF